MLKNFYEQEKIEKINKQIIYILLGMLCIIPIVAYKHTSVSYSPVFMINTFSTGIKVDIFNFYKAIFLYLGTGMIFILFIYKVFFLKEEIKKGKFNLIMLLLLIAIILSLVMSEYKDIALFGSFNRNEGALAWICYLFILFVIYNIKIDNKYFQVFYYALLPFLIINASLSIIKLFGYDILQNSIVQSLLGGKGDLHGQFFTTLGHYNFGSGISAVIFSSSFMYLLLEKNIKNKMLIFIISGFAFAMNLAFISNGGFITIVVLMPIIVILSCRFNNKKNVFVWTGAQLALNTIVYFVLNHENQQVYSESIAVFSKLNATSPLIIPAIIVLFIVVLIIMKFTNKKKFFDYSLIISITFISICVGMYSYNLNKQNEVLAQNHKSEVARIQETNLFNKINEISTDRLNIWTKTLDLINDKPLLGYGFDTFPYVFISNDENGGYSTYNEVIDKPHNWYLSVAYGSGLIGLIGLLGVLVYIIRGMFYSCVDKVNDKYIYIFGIGCIAYAVQGLFNDSFVGTSIIFWIFAGLCLNKLNEIKEIKVKE